MMQRPPNLLQACDDGDLAQVEAILKEQTPRQSTDEEWQQLLYHSLFKAIWNSDRRVVGALLDHGVEMSGGCFGALVNKANIPVFEESLKHGLDVNAYIDQGETLLRVAMGKPTLVKWLLDHGAQPDLPNRRGVTPLATCAVLEPRPEVVKSIDLLLAAGADLSKAKDILHRAISPTAKAGVDMLKHLLSRGVDTSYNHPDKGTPLQYAASLGMMEAARVLAETEGVDVGAVVDGYSAADVARMRGYPEIAEMLESRGRRDAST